MLTVHFHLFLLGLLGLFKEAMERASHVWYFTQPALMRNRGSVLVAADVIYTVHGTTVVLHIGR